MSEDLTSKSLSERIAEKKAEKEEIWTSQMEEVRQTAKSESESVKSEFKSCGSKLRASVRDEADLTRSVIEGDLRELRTGIARKMFWSLTNGVLLVAGVALGLWGLISFLSRDIQQKIETRRVLAAEIEQQQKSVERLKGTTWGVTLVEVAGGRRFVVLPEGTRVNPPLILDGEPWVELSSE